MHNEGGKASGILNGIDTQVWNPETDPLLENPLQNNDVAAFKAKNKALICETFGLRIDLPLIVRFAIAYPLLAQSTERAAGGKMTCDLE